jgi:hypothetical protein
MQASGSSNATAVAVDRVLRMLTDPAVAFAAGCRRVDSRKQLECHSSNILVLVYLYDYSCMQAT